MSKQSYRIPIKRDTPTATLPTKGSDLSVGWDLFADLGFGEKIMLFPGRRALISLGVSMALPEDKYLQLAPRSGLAFKQGIMVMGGVIDADYRDTIKALLFNSGDAVFEIKHGDRIIQGILLPRYTIEWEETDRLSDTKRGLGGLGSTGV